MQGINIDTYIAKFEEHARNAGYTTGNEETTFLFLKGLPTGILKDIMSAPTPVGYQQTKEKAVSATGAQQILNQLLQRRGGFPSKPQFQPRPQFQPQAPFYGKPQTSQNYNQPRYNSSNAPQSMNNQPVPMDLGRNQARRPLNRNNNWRARNNATNTTGNNNNGSSGACFQCGQTVHFARECP
jgi:hypothetical protein